jgi:HEAT repeat protein
MVEPARDKLVAMADSSIPYMMSMLNTESARERLALGVVLPRFKSRVVPQLIDTVLRGAPDRRGMAMYVLGEIKDSTAAIALGRRLLDTSSWRVRASAAEALLKMHADSAKPYFRQALRDTVEIVRARAARALVNVADSAELASLIEMMDDPSQIVRHQIQIGLQYRDIDTVDDVIADALLSHRDGYIHTLLYPIAEKITDSDIRKRIVEEMLADSEPSLRAEAVRLAITWQDESALSHVAKLKRKEKNSLVLFEIYRAIDLQKELREQEKERRKRHNDDRRANETDKKDSKRS